MFFLLTYLTILVRYQQQNILLHFLPPKKKKQKPSTPQSPSWLWGFFINPPNEPWEPWSEFDAYQALSLWKSFDCLLKFHFPVHHPRSFIY